MNLLNKKGLRRLDIKHKIRLSTNNMGKSIDIIIEDIKKRTGIEPSKLTLDLVLNSPYVKMVSTFGFSGFLGYSIGYSVKQAFKVVLLLTGMSFMLVKVLAYKNYVTINWPLIKKDIVGIVDTNKDGHIDHLDVRYYIDQFIGMMTNNVPGATGVSTGIFLGMING